MATNTLKSPAQEEKEGKPSSSIFAWLEGNIKLEAVFRDGIPAQHLPKIAYAFFLCLLYIGISHHSNRTIHRLNKAKILLEDMRVNFTTQKAELMYKSKQSEVARQVEALGLKESNIPPNKITLNP
ncbi:MAG TPA: FtsL-like putative cell division protein [Catalimonadaceae bacterium]|nr:FtsL-like putative cell division protein [Catalimonadaceae bacterium]